MAEFLSTYVKELKNNDIVISSISFNNLVSTDQLSNYLKNTGGAISGDLILLSGNYIQTNNLICTLNYSYKNSFLQTEFVEDHPEWGIACTGSKGYCILQSCPSLSAYSDLSIYPDTAAVKLSGDITELASNLDKRYSWAFGSGGDSQTLEIEAIDVEKQIVVFKTELPSIIISARLSSEEEMIYAFDHDDNAIYCPKNPTIGNVVIHNFYANHSEGGSTKAIGKYTHAEGRNAIADMRYSHAEGDSTFAGRMASHAEGQNTMANGNYSHSEGRKTYVDNLATAAHAEGIQTSAFSEYSHAEGQYTTTYSAMSLNGYVITQNGIDAINNALSINTAIASFKYSIGDIITIKANGNEYFNCSKILDVVSVTSNRCRIVLDYIPIDNASSTSYIYCGVKPTIGSTVVYQGGSSHVEGCRSTASEMYSHAEGAMTTASNAYAHAEGFASYATNLASHSEGYGTSANGMFSHTAGIYSNAVDDCSWCWNGLSSTKYLSKGFGTFCINPANGIDGFYINDKSLSDILSSNSNIYIADEETLSLSGNKFSVKPNVFAEISAVNLSSCKKESWDVQGLPNGYSFIEIRIDAENEYSRLYYSDGTTVNYVDSDDTYDPSSISATFQLISSGYTYSISAFKQIMNEYVLGDQIDKPLADANELSNYATIKMLNDALGNLAQIINTL